MVDINYYGTRKCILTIHGSIIPIVNLANIDDRILKYYRIIIDYPSKVMLNFIKVASSALLG